MHNVELGAFLFQRFVQAYFWYHVVSVGTWSFQHHFHFGHTPIEEMTSCNNGGAPRASSTAVCKSDKRGLRWGNSGIAFNGGVAQSNVKRAAGNRRVFFFMISSSPSKYIEASYRMEIAFFEHYFFKNGHMYHCSSLCPRGIKGDSTSHYSCTPISLKLYLQRGILVGLVCE